MGAFDGGLTYSVYYVDGEVGDGWRERFASALNKGRFDALELDAEEASGWAHPTTPLSDRLSLPELMHNEYLLVALRVDRWAISAATKRAHIAKAYADYMHEAVVNRVGRHAKADIKERVMRELREQSMPQMKLIDVAWSMDTQVVRIWTQSKKTLEAIETLFMSTFGLRLIPCAPYTAAMAIGTERPTRLLGLIPWVPARDAQGDDALPEPDDGPDAAPDLLLAVEGTRWLGLEFLTWVWFMSETNGGKITITISKTITESVEVYVDDAIELVSPTGSAHTAKLSGSTPAESHEARAALAQGKLVSRAKFVLERHSTALRWSFTAIGSTIGMAGVKIPLVLADEEEEKLMQRLYYIEEVESYWLSIYREFLRIRLDHKAWKMETRRMNMWIHSPPPSEAP